MSRRLRQRRKFFRLRAVKALASYASLYFNIILGALVLLLLGTLQASAVN